MTDWSDQIAEFQRSWVQQQQKLMTDWLESMKSAGGGASAPDWRQAADVMEQQVNSALDAQKRSLRAVAEKMESVEGAPNELNQAVKQLEDGIERWAEVQQEMWQVWFDMLREASPKPQSPGETMMKSWEDMAKRTMSIQQQWLSSLTGGQSDTGGASPAKQTKKKTKKSPSSSGGSSTSKS